MPSIASQCWIAFENTAPLSLASSSAQPPAPRSSMSLGSPRSPCLRRCFWCSPALSCITAFARPESFWLEHHCGLIETFESDSVLHLKFVDVSRAEHRRLHWKWVTGRTDPTRKIRRSGSTRGIRNVRPESELNQTLRTAGRIDPEALAVWFGFHSEACTVATRRAAQLHPGANPLGFSRTLVNRWKR